MPPRFASSMRDALSASGVRVPPEETLLWRCSSCGVVSMLEASGPGETVVFFVCGNRRPEHFGHCCLGLRGTESLYCESCECSCFGEGRRSQKNVGFNSARRRTVFAMMHDGELFEVGETQRHISFMNEVERRPGVASVYRLRCKRGCNGACVKTFSADIMKASVK